MTPSREERIEKLKIFNRSCANAGFKEVAPYVFEKRGSFTKTLTLCTLIHGNEVGGIEVFLNILEEIQSQKVFLKSNLRLMLGNVDAYCEDKRYLESDMNRSFGLKEHQNIEERRAHELEKFLNDSDVLVDIHQTIGPTTTPFFIFEYDERSYNLARSLHSTLPVVTNTRERPFKGKTSTAYIISKGGMGVTVETGQKGIENTQISLGLQIAKEAMHLNLEKPSPTSPFLNTFTFFQILGNPDGTLELVKQFNNFDQVKKDELIARNKVSEIFSEVDGVILFPKYGDYAKLAPELALILRPVKSIDDFEW